MTYKVGDKIQILDKDEIVFGCDLTNGSIYEVVDVRNQIDILITTDEPGETLNIYEEELNCIRKVDSGTDDDRYLENLFNGG